MAQYKVPQDVEAEDKLIGPFSFRQFIYLGIAALGIVIAFGLWQIFPGLIVVPLPVILLFLVLALPLRKDQPMETYLTAVIRFFLKPRRRLWQPEGSVDLVTIVAPRTAEVQLTKSLSGADAAAQLGYLAQVVDTQGWATRGVLNPTASMNDTVYAEAQQAEDVFDENTNVVRTFENMLDKSNDARKESVMQQFRQAAKRRDTPEPTPSEPSAIAEPVTSVAASDADENTPPQTQTSTAQPATNDDPPADFHYNPYPSNMHQHVLSPLGSKHSKRSAGISNQSSTEVAADDRKPTTDYSAQSTSLGQPSPDIIRLANNNDLSISALANEAHRLSEKDEEVVINLH